MKCKNIKIDIPGATDILFCKDIELQQTSGSNLFPGLRGNSGYLIIQYYASEDMSWIYDWFELIDHYTHNRIPTTSDLSNVTYSFLKRKFKLYYINDDNHIVAIYTLHNTFPSEITYNDNINSTAFPENTNLVTLIFGYDYCESTYI